MNRYAYTEQNDVKEKGYLHKDYLKVVDEYFDITDTKTRNDIMYVNEQDQSKILTALTGKLYDAIVDKVDDIDYGDIPESKGDITKLPNYDKLVNCIDILEKLLNQYKQDITPIQTIRGAINNIRIRKEVFEKAFKFGFELPVVLYCNTCLAIIGSVSLMIATCIDFIKTPTEDTFQISLDRVALGKTKDNLLFVNLEKINKSCKKGELDKVLDHIIGSKIKKLTGVSIVLVASLIPIMTVLALNIIPILRYLTYFGYNMKCRVSDYFDIQADLLQMNAYNIENDLSKNEQEKDEIVKKQMAIVNRFRKIANKLAIKTKESENKSIKEITNSNKKIKSDEIESDDSMSLF